MRSDQHDRSTYLARYGEHSSRLQNWIGGYGAGLATALIYHFRTALTDARESLKHIDTKYSPDELPDALIHIDVMKLELRYTLGIIAIALGFQLFELTLNKWSQWTLAHMSEHKATWNRLSRFAHWLSGRYWVDFSFDTGSVVLLAVATYTGMRALALV